MHYYDSLGRIKREMSYDTTNNEWPTTTYDYNHDSQCAHIVDPRGAETSMEHLDSLIMRKVEPSGAVTEYSYYPQSDPAATRKLLRDETYSPDGVERFVNRYFYDECGRLVETEYAIPSGAYDPAGYARESNAGMKEVIYDYAGNTMGQPTNITEYLKNGVIYQASKVTERQYNIYGDLEGEIVKDKDGNTVSWVENSYDSQGRLICESKRQDEGGLVAQERKLEYVNNGISRFKPVTEYISHHHRFSHLLSSKHLATPF
jgi:uncharacterized protein RhaS with RHS repeats